MPKKAATTSRRSKAETAAPIANAEQMVIGADEPIEVEGNNWLVTDVDGEIVHDGAGKPQLAEPFASMEFFDLLPALPSRLWESELVLYLYRLNPEVTNKSGEKKYIGVYSAPMTEEDFKREHGGGKYRLYLKYKKHDLRTSVFQIDGPPKFIEGQTLRGVPVGPAVTAPAPSPTPDLAMVLNKLVDTINEKRETDPAGALNSAVQILTTATQKGLELQQTLSAKNANSLTGYAFGDKLMEQLLPRLLDPPKPPSLTDTITMVKEITAILRPPREARAENPAPATTQIDVIKEFFGVESLSEVLDKVKGGGKDNTPWWGSFLVNTIEKLTTAAPSIIAQYAQLQREQFERALQVNTIRSGRRPPEVAILPGAPAVAAPAPAAGPANAAEAAFAAIEPMVRMMCDYYDRGFDGSQAAAGLHVQFPDMTEQFKPVLTDLMKLNQFIAEIPQLAERAKDPEWEEFRDEFWREMNVKNEPDETVADADHPPQVESEPQTGALSAAQ